MKKEWLIWVAGILFVGQLVLSMGLLIRQDMKIARLEQALANHAQVIQQLAKIAQEGMK